MRIQSQLIRLLFIVFSLVLAVAFPVWVQAQSVPPGKVDLTLNVIGSYPGNITPAADNRFFLEIRNNGSTTVNNIRFSSNIPDGWTVDFQPASLNTLGPGSSLTIDVNIIPDKSAARGDFNLTLLAQADETRGVTSLFVQVTGGPSYWLWVGIGLGILAIIVFIIIYVRSAKQ